MAAYSCHPRQFLLSSSFFPNTGSFDLSAFSNNMPSEFSPMEAHHDGFSDAVAHHQSSCQDYSSKKHSSNISIDMKKVEEKKSRKGSSLTSTQSKRRKVQGKTKKEKGGNTIGEKKMTKASKKNTKKTSDDSQKDYIHVRARRGQATDSHSLAERVRRERISERMKMLQALVPGCEKVTGKTLMLDEIINYVQSLQNQIEFLSMNLASCNSIYSNFAMDLYASILRQERLSTLEASQPSGSSQLCSPTAVNYKSPTTGYTALTVFHPLIETSLLQQEAAENLAWNQMDSQTRNFMNQSGLCNDMCSFQ